jgi:bifunctional non-homologous end joining protein LigD
VQRAIGTAPAVLVAFDVLRIDGQDLRALPWQQRQDRLAELGLSTALVPGVSALRRLEVVDDGPALIRATHELRIEGVVAKHRRSPYRIGRAQSWVKVKHAFARDLQGSGWRSG